MMGTTLYGVGVGPGAPDLLTLRAARILRSVPVLALPRSNPWGKSVAWSILEPTLGDITAQERLFLTFPMVYEASRLQTAWDAACAAIGPHLRAGRSVAFATEGCPSLFSTWTYVARAAAELWPQVRVEIVPGVTSVTAVPAVAGIPLAAGHQRIAILPATYGVDDLRAILRAFDTIVLMKIGPQMDTVVCAVEREGLLNQAIYVAKATMGEQRIERDIRAIRHTRGDCFAMIVVSRDARHGPLAEAAPGLAARLEKSEFP